ncbi:response regulator [Candidatus Poribacteria bacterium]|nr:response regulator [Candidatus Poribacteria bacterium]
MKTVKNQLILIVEPDAHFRETLYNFLLSAGYEKVDSAENFNKALEKMRGSVYNAVVLDAGSPPMEGVKFAKRIAALNPKMRVILMLRAEDQQKWNASARKGGEFQFLIKTTFTRNLLYLLEGHA